MGNAAIRLLMTASISLISAGVALAAEATPSCAPISDLAINRVTTYISKKYRLPSGVELRLKETATLTGCYHKLQLVGRGPIGTFDLSMYASPDGRFLAPELFDTSGDPEREAAENAKALLGQLTEGEFASTGPQDAPVTMVIFADFQCPYCKRLADTLRTDPMVSRSNRDLRIVFRHLPLPQHQWARRAAEAAACAQFQNEQSFWQLHDFFFANQETINAANFDSKVGGAVRSMPTLDLETFRQCVDRQLSLGAVVRDEQLARTVGANATPTIFINGRTVDDWSDLRELHEALQAVAAKP